MIKISKEDAALIKERFPDAAITITGRHTSHKKYYVGEDPKIVKFLSYIKR